MMAITKNDIKHIAALARVGLKKEEIERYQKELSAILNYFEKLNKLDTNKIEPIGHIAEVNNVFGQDSVREGDNRTHKLIFQNIPQVKNKRVKVKPVL